MNSEIATRYAGRSSCTPPGLKPSAVGGPSVWAAQGACTPETSSDFRRVARPSKHRFLVTITSQDHTCEAFHNLLPDEVCFLVLDALDAGRALTCAVEVVA